MLITGYFSGLGERCLWCGECGDRDQRWEQVQFVVDVEFLGFVNGWDGEIEKKKGSR